MTESIEAPKKDDRNLRRQFTDLAHRCELLADAVNAGEFGLFEIAAAMSALGVAAKAIEQAKGDLFPAKR